MTVVRAVRSVDFDFSDTPNCSVCSKELKFGDGAIAFVFRVPNRLVCCEKCSHAFVSAFIQDYDKLLAGDAVFNSAINKPQAVNISKACNNINKALSDWVEAHDEFSSL
jgi:hypothetical protein